MFGFIFDLCKSILSNTIFEHNLKNLNNQTMKKILQFVLLIPLLIFAQPNSDGAYFDGVDDELLLPSLSTINSRVTNNRTYEMSFRAKSTASRQILMKEGGDTRAVILYVENGYLILGGYNRADYWPNWRGTFYRTPIDADKWYHVALVFDDVQPGSWLDNYPEAGGNSALKFYLDGVLKAENSGYELGAHDPLALGYKNQTLLFPRSSGWAQAQSSDTEYSYGRTSRDFGGNEYYFKGNIWGFRVWNDVRTPEELEETKNTIIMTVGLNDLVAALDGDTLTFMGNEDDPGHKSMDNLEVLTWKTSAASTSWSDASNWENSNVPESDKLHSVVLPSGAANYPVIESHITVGSFTMGADVTVEVKTGATLDIHYDLESEGVIKVENNGSLLIREGEADKYSYAKGLAEIDRDSPDYQAADFYSIWSTPLFKEDSKIADIFTNPIRAFKWDASLSTPKYVEITDKNTLMDIGTGYFIRSDKDKGTIKRTFNGKINNGDIYTLVYYNGRSANLIGNPYSSALNWDAVYNDNKSVVKGSIYYWKHTGFANDGSTYASDYIAYNLTGSNLPGVTGNIASGQGVFVKSKLQGNILFKNCHRVAGNNSQFYKTQQTQDNSKLWLKLSNEKAYSALLLGYINGATNAYSDAFDADYRGSGAVVKFYSVLDDKQLSVQGRMPLEEFDEDSVPLGFEAKTSGNYTISILKETINSGLDIMLEDLETGQFTNLRLQDYKFSVLDPIVNNNRFMLHLKNNGTLGATTTAIEEQNKLKSYFKGDQLVTQILNQDISIQKFEVFDMSGKLVINSTYKDVVRTPLSAGVYLVNYYLNENNVITKKVIKPF